MNPRLGIPIMRGNGRPLPADKLSRNLQVWAQNTKWGSSAWLADSHLSLSLMIISPCWSSSSSILTALPRCVANTLSCPLFLRFPPQLATIALYALIASLMSLYWARRRPAGTTLAACQRASSWSWFTTSDEGRIAWLRSIIICQRSPVEGTREWAVEWGRADVYWLLCSCEWKG